jgi:UDP-glucuronate 4-epimerase
MKLHTSPWTVLVTGGAGFIGSHLIEHLLWNGVERVVCLDDFNAYYSPARKRANIAGFVGDSRVTLIEGSFCEEECVEMVFRRHRISHVVHLGAYAGVRPSIENPAIYQRTNVAGTLTLLEAARRFPVERFLLISSSTVYGKVSAPFLEAMPLGLPLSPYGATKRAAELLGLKYADLHAVPVVCLRPFSVYGPRLRPDLVLSIFCDAIECGRPVPIFGDGTILRDFTHVSDICEGLRAALTARGVIGECINLGHAEPFSIRTVVEMLERRLGRRARIEWHPANPDEMPVTCADLQKAGALLGYSPRVPFAAGLDDYVAWRAQQRRGFGIYEMGKPREFVAA